MVLFVVLKGDGQGRVGTLDIDVMVLQYPDDACHQYAVEEGALLFAAAVDFRIDGLYREDLFPQGPEPVLPGRGHTGDQGTVP